MKIALQIVSWIGVVLGTLAILGNEGDYYAVFGGALFLLQGVLALVYINSQEKTRS